MKMQYDVEKKKILMTQNDAKELEMFVKGHKAASMKTRITSDAQEEFLAIDLLPYAENVPKDMWSTDFLSAVKSAAARFGVIL